MRAQYFLAEYVTKTSSSRGKIGLRFTFTGALDLTRWLCRLHAEMMLVSCFVCDFDDDQASVVAEDQLLSRVERFWVDFSTALKEVNNIGPSDVLTSVIRRRLI